MLRTDLEAQFSNKVDGRFLDRSFALYVQLFENGCQFTNVVYPTHDLQKRMVLFDSNQVGFYYVTLKFLFFSKSVMEQEDLGPCYKQLLEFGFAEKRNFTFAFKLNNTLFYRPKYGLWHFVYYDASWWLEKIVQKVQTHCWKFESSNAIENHKAL